MMGTLFLTISLNNALAEPTRMGRLEKEVFPHGCGAAVINIKGVMRQNPFWQL